MSTDQDHGGGGIRARRREVSPWYQDAKLGIMIHWGLDTAPGLLAGPALASWRPEPWARLCADSGARYVIGVATCRDGVPSWPSSHPNPAHAGRPAGRDLLGELAEATRAEGLRWGVCYSGPEPEPEPADAQDVDNHWRELIARYRPSVLWNGADCSRGAADAGRLVADYRRTVPDGVVNDRFESDSTDFETVQHSTRPGIAPGVWEVVRAISPSSGQGRDQTTGLTPEDLVHLLADVVSRNGNLLLGITSDARGEIPADQRDLLGSVGRWLAAHGEAIYDTRPWTRAEARTVEGRPVRFTRRGHTLYAIVLGSGGRRIPLSGLRPGRAARVRQVGGGPAIAPRWRVRHGEPLVELPAPSRGPGAVIAIDGI